MKTPQKLVMKLRMALGKFFRMAILVRLDSPYI